MPTSAAGLADRPQGRPQGRPIAHRRHRCEAHRPWCRPHRSWHQPHRLQRQPCRSGPTTAAAGSATTSAALSANRTQRYQPSTSLIARRRRRRSLTHPSPRAADPLNRTASKQRRRSERTSTTRLQQACSSTVRATKNKASNTTRFRPRMRTRSSSNRFGALSSDTQAPVRPLTRMCACYR